MTDEELKRRQAFSAWLQRELKLRGWRPQKLADESDVDASTLGLILRTERGIGPDVARKLAAGLNLPQPVVFYECGIQTEAPVLDSRAIDMQVITGLQRLQAMTPEQRALAIELMEAILRHPDWQSRP